MKRGIQSLIIIFLFNAALMAAAYWMAGDGLRNQSLAFFGTGLLLSLVLWFVLQRMEARPAEEAPSEPQHPADKAEAPSQPSAASAIQMLSILQRKGRLIDFLQEDLQQYEDAQIGAAVRNVHEGCKQALDEHVELEPIIEDEEGSEITVEREFDARAIRLTGNITGDPPFRGALRHRGWRVKSIDLPEQMQKPDDNMIVEAAEVEVT